MKRIAYSIIALLALVSCNSKAPSEKLAVNLNEKGAPVASSMYGIFFEEINNAGDGGLYAELVMNRSFEELEMPEGYKAEGEKLIPKQVNNHSTGKVENQTFKWTTDPVPGWFLNADPTVADMKLTKELSKFESAPTNLKVNIKNAQNPVSLINKGYWGMNMVSGEKYFLRAIIRTSANYKGTVTVKMLSDKGEVLTSSGLGALKANEWNDISLVLTPTANNAKALLALEFNSTGTVWVDYVSLLPEKTFNNRPNGFRPDVAEFLVGLKPAFVRWPGGCVVEGISLENAFEWKKTLGDPAARSGEYSLWGYRNTYGFGYHEFLQFCEDINAQGMFVCNVGMGCQYRMSDVCSHNDIQYYLENTFDAIEYAIGDITTEWGAKRAAAGHPEPFPLQYVEIGNENRGPVYDERFDIFYTAIKERYPQLTLISNHGITGTGNIKKTDMVDPHYYVAPDYFFTNTNIFDKLERGKYTVYVGEYAVNSGVGAGNMMAALSEAAFITGMERNGDLVTMASYAPLLENRNNRCWAVNLIWLDTDQVVGRSSYYVQKMSAENKPDYNFKMNKTMADAKPASIPAGAVGVGTWVTSAEFKDFRITQGEKTFDIDMNNVATKRGEWTVSDGVLSQTSMEQATRLIFGGFEGNDFTLEFKGRKMEGKEGFFVYFASHNKNRNGFAFNLGGWDNTTTAVQNVMNGSTSSQVGNSVQQTLESEKWYNVKVEVKADKAEIFVDNEPILAYQHTTTPLQFFASGYDEKSGEAIIKVVNADSTAYSAQLVLNGASKIEKTGKVISLVSQSGNDENSFEEPKKIFPSETLFSGFGKNFTFEFKPYSFTILRVKATLNN